MAKKCKKCWKLNENPMYKLCRACTYEESRNNPRQTKMKQKPLKNKSTTNKNTPARFSDKTKRAMYERDKCCIICWSPWTEFHHCWFWPHNAKYWPERNDLDQGVLLCHDCHYEIHHGVKWKGKLYNAKCIEYLAKLKK